jgi:cell division transport system ATP-binding protein
MIEMQDVWKVYPDGTEALRGINVEIAQNEFVYLVGPSGAGKSTFMRLIYREEKPTRGEVIVSGYRLNQLKARKIPFVRRSIGVIFQNYQLLPKKTAYENVAFALEVVEAPKRMARERAMEALELVGLKGKENEFPSHLSGGEGQRVAIARAMVRQPKILIADEPTANLDEETSLEIVKLLIKINHYGTTVLMITHDTNIVKKLRHRIVKMAGGRIVGDGRLRSARNAR